MTAGTVDQKTHSGGCVCGAVRFEASAPLRGVIACHCTQCRRTSGHFWAATAARREGVKVFESVALAWFQSSATARRGFCSKCGSSLFWQGPDASYTAIAAGALDDPTGLKLEAHIYLADKGDYYAVDDSAAQHEHDDHAVPAP